MALLNYVFENDGVIVDYLYSSVIDLHFIQSNEGVHLISCYDGSSVIFLVIQFFKILSRDAWTFAHHEYVVEDDRSAVGTLDVEASLSAGDHGVVAEDEFVVCREVC